MSFVYRYKAQTRTKYYGMVRGDRPEDLLRRLNEHRRDPSFSPSWRVEYLEGLTPVEADLLETHFINTDGESLINKAKRRLGEIRFSFEFPLEWKDVGLLTGSARPSASKSPDHSGIAKCPICRRAGPARRLQNVRLEMEDTSGTWTMIASYMCEQCRTALAEHARPLFDAFDVILDELKRNQREANP